MMGQKHARKKILSFPRPSICLGTRTYPCSTDFNTFMLAFSLCNSLFFGKLRVSPSPVNCGDERENLTCDNAGVTRISLAERRILSRIFGLSHSHATTPAALGLLAGLPHPLSFFPPSLSPLPPFSPIHLVYTTGLLCQYPAPPCQGPARSPQ